MSEKVEGLDPELEALLSSGEIDAPLNGKISPGSTPPPAAPQRRKPHHRRRRPPEENARPPMIANPNEAAPPPASPTSPPISPASPSEEPSLPLPVVEENSKSAFVVWPRVLQYCAAKQMPANQIGIRIQRIPTGPQNRGPGVDLEPFSGDLVEGSADQSPADSLYEYVRDYYHMSSRGPATYKMTFFLRFGGKGTIPGVMELNFDSPEAIERQRMAAASARLRTSAMGAGASGFALPWRGGGAAPSSPAGPSPQEFELLKRMAGMSEEKGYLRAMVEALEKGQAPALAATTAPPAPPARDPRLPPPGLSEVEWEEILARRQAKAMGPVIVQSLTAMGFTPNLLKNIADLLAGSARPQAPAAPAAAPDPFEPFDKAIQVMAAFKKFQERMGVVMPEAAGEAPALPKDDPSAMKVVAGGLVKFPGTDTPMSWGQKLDDESWPEFFLRWGTHNPGAMQAVIERAAKIVDPQALGKLMNAAAERMAKKPPAPAPAAPPAAPQAPAAPQMGWAPRE
jgi:hypothetical protein